MTIGADFWLGVLAVLVVALALYGAFGAGYECGRKERQEDRERGHDC
jgi:hypothetical protein